MSEVAPHILETPEQAHEAISHEMLDYLAEVDPPEGVFKLGTETKTLIKNHAIDSGSLAGASFSNCPPFEDMDSKKARQEAFKAARLYEIISAEAGATSIVDKATAGYTNDVIWRAVITEAARQAHVSHDHDDDNYDMAVDLIREGNECLYPKPDILLAKRAMGLFVPSFDNLSEVEDESIKNWLAECKPDKESIEPSRGAEPHRLEPETAEAIKQYFEEELGDTFKALREEFGDITNELVVDATNRFLQLTGFTDKGWKCENVGKSRVGFYVRPFDKVLECGDRTIKITWKMFEGLMVHEVMTHVNRADRGLATGFVPLTLGLAGYDGAEEGVATTFQTCWKEEATKNSAVSVDQYRYIIGSYAAGIVDNEAHSLDETFQFISNLRTAAQLSGLSKKDPEFYKREDFNLELVKRDARKFVFEHVFRFFRGMPEGSVLLKDLSYFKGSQDMVDWINDSKMEIPQMVEYLTRGKFDPCKEEDRQLISMFYHD